LFQFAQFTRTECGWSLKVSGADQDGIMASVLSSIGVGNSEDAWPSEPGPVSVWNILSFAYARFMMRSEHLFVSAEPAIKWPGVPGVAALLIQSFTNKMVRTQGRTARPKVAAQVLLAGTRCMISQSDTLADMQLRYYMALKHRGLTEADMTLALRRIFASATPVTLDAVEFDAFFTARTGAEPDPLRPETLARLPVRSDDSHAFLSSEQGAQRNGQDVHG
jgi:hypothetical protein